jgi:hypothetical protein
MFSYHEIRDIAPVSRQVQAVSRAAKFVQFMCLVPLIFVHGHVRLHRRGDGLGVILDVVFHDPSRFRQLFSLELTQSAGGSTGRVVGDGAFALEKRRVEPPRNRGVQSFFDVIRFSRRFPTGANSELLKKTGTESVR